MILKQVNLELLKDFGFSPNELIELEASKDDKFINYKCLTNESVLPTIQAIPLDRVKQAREEIKEKIHEYSGSGNEVTQAYCDGFKDSLTILDNLIAEGEEK